MNALGHCRRHILHHLPRRHPALPLPIRSPTARPRSISELQSSMSAIAETAQAQLDKSQFTQTVRVPALRVPKQHCGDLMRRLKGYTLDMPKMRCIVPDGANDGPNKLLLLAETLNPDSLPQPVQDIVQSGSYEVLSHDLLIDYSHMQANDILKRVLPDGVEAPSSFETVGHIIHLNLRKEQLPYKYIIGQVLLDKNPHIKTVVNKVGSIENEFRVFTMELLAGEDRTETEVTQHGLRFRLDFAQVYWNSRLDTEHKRLVSHYFAPGHVIVDMMAGIGPFAVPAATQAGCKVYANDLNPNSAAYMAVNVKLNRVGHLVSVFNMCGRDFVRMLCAAPPVQHTPPLYIKQSSTQPGADGHAAEQPAAAAAPAGTSANGGASHTQSQHDDSHTQQGNGTGPSHSSPAQHTGTSTQQGATGAAPAQSSGQGTGTSHTGNGSLAEGASNGPSALPTVLVGTTASASGSKQQGKKQQPLVVPPPVPDGFTVPAGGLLFDHVVMNLPASAIQFLNTFNGAFDPEVWAGRLPLVHLYTFKTGTMTEQDVIATMEHYLGGPLDAPPAIHNVRDVSPHKIMLCVTFRVPENVAYNGRQRDVTAEATKRQKV